MLRKGQTPPACRRHLRYRRVYLAALIASGISAGCATAFRVDGYQLTPAGPSDHFIGGAARVDITPPAGYPMGGHSLAGRISRGHWLRLYARAFYLRDRTGASVALVSCDLFAISAGLQQKVASLLHHPKPGETEVADIGRDNLVIAATHTHQGPGNYMSSKFYNGLASPYPGFDESLYKRLAAQIASAVRQAVQNAVDHPEGVRIILRRGKALTLARNRSVKAFLENPALEQAEVINEGPTPPATCPAPCPRYQAIDPTISILAIERVSGGIAGALVFGAIHPTVMRNNLAVNSPDLVGVAMGRLERDKPGMVAGFFNGAEGDVSPRWELRDAEETRALGEALASSIRDVLATSPGAQVGDGDLIAARRVAAAREDFCHGAWPVPGVAEVGGAEDGRFITFDQGWRAPYRRTQEPKKKSFLLRFFRSLGRDKSQEPKEPALDLKELPILQITALAAPKRGFPTEVPVSLLTVGPLVSAAVPVEMTTTMGRRVRRAVAEETGKEHVLLIGLANEYYGYVTTHEEYQTQEYEGASTLFGHASDECYLDLLRRAGALPPGTVAQNILDAEFDPGPGPFLNVAFGPGYWGENPEFADQELFEPFVRGAFVPGGRFPRFEWQAGQETKTQLLTSLAGNWIVEQTDDEGFLVTVIASGATTPPTWHTVWTPEEAHDRTSLHVIKIEAASEVACSVAFSLDQLATGSVQVPLPTGPCPI